MFLLIPVEIPLVGAVAVNRQVVEGQRLAVDGGLIPIAVVVHGDPNRAEVGFPFQDGAGLGLADQTDVVGADLKVANDIGAVRDIDYPTGGFNGIDSRLESGGVIRDPVAFCPVIGFDVDFGRDIIINNSNGLGGPKPGGRDGNHPIPFKYWIIDNGHGNGFGSAPGRDGQTHPSGVVASIGDSSTAAS